MSSRPGVVLVTGATGQQGGACARHLLEQGWKVRALSRNPAGGAAQRLAAAGAEVVPGDFDDRPSVERALAGVYGVFSVQTMLDKGGVVREERQGVMLAEAAAAAGVRHFVYTSVGAADRGTGIPHFESKWRIEQRIRALGMPATVLRPVFFVDNLMAGGAFGFITWGAMASALKSGKSLQVIAVDDIGAIAAAVFAAPERFIGQSIEIAGDDVTFAQLRDAWRAVTGRSPRYLPFPAGLLKRMDHDLGEMFAWFKVNNFRADLAALRVIHTGLQDAPTALRTLAKR